MIGCGDDEGSEGLLCKVTVIASSVPYCRFQADMYSLPPHIYPLQCELEDFPSFLHHGLQIRQRSPVESAAAACSGSWITLRDNPDTVL